MTTEREAGAYASDISRLLENLIEERRIVVSGVGTTQAIEVGRKVKELNELINAVKVARKD